VSRPSPPAGLQRLNISSRTAAMISCGLGLSTYSAVTAASAAECQLGAMLAAGGPTSSRTTAASTAWCNSGDTGSELVPLLLLLAAAAAVVLGALEGSGVGTRWGAAWRSVMQAWRATQASW
jgi:hypothetical protein